MTGVGDLVQFFFADCLQCQRGLRPNSVHSYRERHAQAVPGACRGAVAQAADAPGAQGSRLRERPRVPGLARARARQQPAHAQPAARGPARILPLRGDPLPGSAGRGTARGGDPRQALPAQWHDLPRARRARSAAGRAARRGAPGAARPGTADLPVTTVARERRRRQTCASPLSIWTGPAECGATPGPGTAMDARASGGESRRTYCAAPRLCICWRPAWNSTQSPAGSATPVWKPLTAMRKSACGPRSSRSSNACQRSLTRTPGRRSAAGARRRTCSTASTLSDTMRPAGARAPPSRQSPLQGAYRGAAHNTNNQAEQDMRMMKLRSVLSTAGKQGWNRIAALLAPPDELPAKLHI